MNVIHPRNELNILIDPMIKQELNEIKYRNNKDIFDNSFYYQVFLCSIDGNFDYFLNKVCDFTKNLNNILLAVIILTFYIIWWAVKVPLLIIHSSLHNVLSLIAYSLLGQIPPFINRLYGVLIVLSGICMGLQHHLVTINVLEKDTFYKFMAFIPNLIKVFQIVLQCIYLGAYWHEYNTDYGIIFILAIIPIMNILYNVLMPYYLLNICKNYKILKWYNLNNKAYNILHDKALEYFIEKKYLFEKVSGTESNAELDCSICMCKENSDIDNSLIKTKCNHIYHYKCLITWVGVSLLNNNPVTCPYCRQDLALSEQSSINESELDADSGYEDIPNLDI